MTAAQPHALDAARLEILTSALNAITEEIQLTLLRSAYSQVVKEAQDASCAIFTADGRIVAQPVVIPGHLGSMRFMLQEVPAAALADPGINFIALLQGFFHQKAANKSAGACDQNFLFHVSCCY